LANLAAALFVPGMRLGMFACEPGKFEAEYHQTLICDQSFVCVALSSVLVFVI
jgi:hypothetical protein